MARIDNFKGKQHTLTAEELSKGGLNSVESRRKRKALKEELIALLEINNNQEKMSLALVEKAIGGDVQAFTTIRDTIGEKVEDKLALNGTVEIEVNLEESE